jgi:hypothetical protein
MFCKWQLILRSARQNLIFIFLSVGLWSYSGLGLLFDGAFRYHSDTAHAVGLLWKSEQTLRPLPNNTQHSQDIDIYAQGGIRNPNPKKRMDADPRLKRPDHRDWLLNYTHSIWRFATHSSYWSNIIKHKTVKRN